MFNVYSYFSIICIFIGRILVVCSNLWFGIWIGLELNMMSFLLLISLKWKLSRVEALVRYFFIQTLGSIILILIIVLGLRGILINLILLPLLLKLGIYPIHYWVVEIGFIVNLLRVYLLLTWQKLAPLIILVRVNWDISIWLIIISILVGSFIGLFQTFVIKLVIFSSIYHLGWLLGAIEVRIPFLILYYLVYSYLLLLLFIILKDRKESFQLRINYGDFKSLILLLLTILVFIGIPPFLGFYIKWVILIILYEEIQWLIAYLFLIRSLILGYSYLRLTYYLLMVYRVKWRIKISNRDRGLRYTLLVISTLFIPTLLM